MLENHEYIIDEYNYVGRIKGNYIGISLILDGVLIIIGYAMSMDEGNITATRVGHYVDNGEISQELMDRVLRDSEVVACNLYHKINRS